MSNLPQFSGSLSGNSLGKLSGQMTATQQFPNGYSGNAQINMNHGRASLNGK